jgi:hypothetical protein
MHVLMGAGQPAEFLLSLGYLVVRLTVNRAVDGKFESSLVGP